MLSKSDYLLYLKHPAWLWLKKNAPAKLPPIDDGLQAMFNAGHKFEAYAESLFEDGVTLGFSNPGEYHSLTGRTQQALAGGAKTIFQSCFTDGDFYCLPDIVQVVGESTVDLYEIKSSTGVKKDHLYDLAFQRAVIEAGGLTVRKIYVIHVNNLYVRKGAIEPAELTITEDVTLLVHELEDSTATAMPAALEVINSSEMPDPSFGLLGALGSRSEWKAIYESITSAEKPDYAGAQPLVLALKLQSFLSQLTFPLYFLDYETMSAVVPHFDGHRPYQQVPMQYSIHILDAPGANLRHVEYLHRANSDPSLPLATQLIEDIGTKGSVITWNMSFEKSCNNTLGQLNPQFASAMAAINERIVDLMIPFKPSNGWYIDPRFEGSASIKKVLPVVVPRLSYKELGIQNGGAAQALWMEAVLDGTRDDKETILNDLLEYCELDTLAMVEIYKVLRSV